MSNAPLMPMATAVWLVENTTLTFKQIADFCKLHEVEIQGIADGEVAKGIKAYNPIISGQLSREEIELSSKDEKRPLNIKSSDIGKVELSKVANIEKKMPQNFISKDGFGITQSCKNYLLHLIQGEAWAPFKDGVIDTASLKNKLTKKKLKSFKI